MYSSRLQGLGHHCRRSATTAATVLQRQTMRYSASIRAAGAANSHQQLGFIGLGHMGSKMVANLSKDGRKIVAFDQNSDAVKAVVSEHVRGGSIESIAANCNVVFSMLPNDKIVEETSRKLFAAAKDAGNTGIVHISCSTISPMTSRALASLHKEHTHTFVASPVFARPDGIAKRQATWMVGGEEKGRKIACELLESAGNCVDMGDDPGAANIVKLCGNFMIAASIESIGESMALADKHGVDRHKVMEILSSSIFDCLIYKGYGDRVSKRDHRPGGFSLNLGLKDVSLVNQAAREGNVPMPFLSVLLDRYVSSAARGRGDFDWSAIGLAISEDAGVDVAADVQRTKKDVEDKNFY